MTQQIVLPTSNDQAIGWLAAAPPPFDSPTQHRIRSRGSLEEAFARGRRRPEWVWSLQRDHQVIGVCAAWGTPHGDERDRALSLDLFGLPDDPALAETLVREASRRARAAGAQECILFAAAAADVHSPVVRPLAALLGRHGWRLLVERRHYEFAPPKDLGAAVPLHLRLEQVQDPADPRLAAVHRQVMRGTLDAHDAATVSRVGFEAACRESLDLLLASDPVDCIRLALDERGDVVGLVSILTTATRRGFVLFVGVAHDHRGRGIGRGLLGWASRQFVEAGVEVVVADTDNANLPMAAAFAAVGWPQTETRIDFEQSS